MSEQAGKQLKANSAEWLLAGAGLIWLLLLVATLLSGALTSYSGAGLGFSALLLLAGYAFARRQRNSLQDLRETLHKSAADSTALLGSLDAMSPLSAEVDAVKLELRQFAQAVVATQSAMRASSQATRNILNSTQNAVFGVDGNGRCLFANSRCHEMLGASLGSLIGESVHERIHSRILGVEDQARCRFCQLDNTERHQDFYNEVIVTADEGHRDIDYQCFLLQSEDQQTMRVVTMLDVTERRSLERQYESLVATVPVGIFSLDRERRLLFGNDRFFEMVGAPRHELLGQKLSAFVHPDDLEDVRSSYHAAFEAGEPYALEHRLRKADGSLLWVLSNGDFRRDSLGEVLGVNGIFTDIDELKSAQAELENLNLTLEARVEERTEALARANEELRASIDQLQQTQDVLIEKEKMASLGGMVAGVAHEINTPIGVSRGAASHLSETLAAYENKLPHDAELDRFRRVLKESSDLIDANLARAADLISRFKRLSVDQSHKDDRQFNLRANILDAAASFGRQLSTRSIDLEVHCDEDLKIYGDPGCYSQLHAIAFTNALEHAYDEDESVSGKIDVEVDLDGDTLNITYRDDGQGIGEEGMAHVFEPFFTTRRYQGGTGLGLHIFYLLVSRRLGGRATCHQVQPHGFALQASIPLNESSGAVEG